jgi:hypothetical protein
MPVDRLHAAPATPVIVELFTSEGCSDCPPADTLLEKLIATSPVADAEIIGLGQHVDYWDRLGWKDRFSSAALTNRQQRYQTRFGTESIYTPQMVVDGRTDFVGSDAGAARKAIEKTLAAPHGRVTIDVMNVGADLAPATTQLGPGAPEREAQRRPSSAAAPGRAEQARPLRVAITITDLPPIGRGDRADIVLAVTERGLTTDVKRGENHGKLLAHAPVVRYLATIGQIADGASGGRASAADLALAPDWQRDRLAVVAFVQQVHSRSIIAAASVPLKNARP